MKILKKIEENVLRDIICSWKYWQYISTQFIDKQAL